MRLLSQESKLDTVTNTGPHLLCREEIIECLNGIQPKFVINCVGYLGDDISKHKWTNEYFPKTVAQWCSDHGVSCVLISTNAVFPGGTERFWLPTDPVTPSAPYECAKALGEEKSARVIRVSFVGKSPHARNIYDRLTLGCPYVDRLWNGVTVLQVAQYIAKLPLSNSDTPLTGIEHFHSPKPIRISDIAHLLSSKSKCIGVAQSSPLLGGGQEQPPFEEQLHDYEDWLRVHH